jgi:polycystin 1L2
MFVLFLLLTEKVYLNSLLFFSKTLVTGSILNYILSVEQCLGPLSFLRIWHDNSGKGKMRSWYLDQVQVSDLQTGERYVLK